MYLSDQQHQQAISFPANDRVAFWAGRIAVTWRDSVDAILGVGRMLADAHAELKAEPKAWARLTGRGHAQMLPFTYRAAEYLKCIGENGRLVNLSSQLPPDWKAIYLLTTLDDQDFERAQREGLITPAMTQVKVRAFKRALRQERERELIPTLRAECQIDHCAIEDVGPDLVADSSVDVVITDPPYLEQHLETFSLLGNFAERTLKPGGWCVVMTGVVFLPEVINRLAAKLTYRWQYVITTPGGANSRIGRLGLFQSYKPVLLFQKPPVSKIREWWSDVINAKPSEQDKSLHRWQQSEAVFAELVNRFSQPGDLVVDPFAGSGTTGRAAINLGRHFWGCDADASCALQAAE